MILLSLVSSGFLALFPGGNDSLLVRGSVTDEAEAAVPGAGIELLGIGVVARTDSAGSFVFIAPTGGRSTILVARALGFSPDTIAVDATARERSVRFRLRRVAIVLDTVRTIASRLVRVGFEERRRRAGGGRYLADTTIRRIGAVRMTELLDQVLGVRIVRGSGATPSERQLGMYDAPVVEIDRGPRRGDAAPCPVKFVLDGVRYEPSAAGIDVELSARSLIGVEVYASGSVPVEFARLGSACGVVVLWTDAVR